jgi:hypothetical protein
VMKYHIPVPSVWRKERYVSVMTRSCRRCTYTKHIRSLAFVC